MSCEDCLNFGYHGKSILVGLCHEKKRFGKPMVIDLTKPKKCSYFEEKLF